MTPISDQEDYRPEYFLGVEIGGSKLVLATGTTEGSIVDRRKFTVVPEQGAEGIRRQITQALPELIERWQPSAIGVGYGGPVDWRTGRIVNSHHISGWNEFRLGEWLENQCGRAVFIDNDANAGALGEALFGAGRGCDPVFYVTTGSGVGGGLVSNGRIYHGFTGGEAEIGHLRLGLEGETPEDCCSGWSLDRRIREAAATQPTGALAQRTIECPGNEAKHLGAALPVDPVAVQIVDEAALRLALALSHVTHLCHPEVIVLGGGVSLLGESWRSRVAHHLRRFIMDAFQPGPRVALASLREDAVCAGAIALASQRFSARKESESHNIMKYWFRDYISAQHRALDSVPIESIERLTTTIRGAWLRGAQIFVIGNGGSAANASHFATDLGKGASGKMPRPFRVLSLTDNLAWLTALANDCSFDEVFLQQLQNYAREGDVLIAASVKGNSPNLLRAFEWANGHGMETAAIVGTNRGKLAQVARQAIVVEDDHYGRVEDVQMQILHMICYAFMEVPELVGDRPLPAANACPWEKRQL